MLNNGGKREKFPSIASHYVFLLFLFFIIYYPSLSLIYWRTKMKIKDQRSRLSFLVSWPGETRHRSSAVDAEHLEWGCTITSANRVLHFGHSTRSQVKRDASDRENSSDIYLQSVIKPIDCFPLDYRCRDVTDSITPHLSVSYFYEAQIESGFDPWFRGDRGIESVDWWQAFCVSLCSEETHRCDARDQLRGPIPDWLLFLHRLISDHGDIDLLCEAIIENRLST